MSDTAPTEAPSAAGTQTVAQEQNAIEAAETALEAAKTALHATGVAKDYDAIVRLWVRETAANSPISQNTAAWNFLYETAAPDLIKRLSA